VVLQEDMVYPIKPELDDDFCGSAFINEPIVSIVVRANSNTVDGEQQWDVLANQREF
jgi:hypothetical protein